MYRGIHMHRALLKTEKIWNRKGKDKKWTEQNFLHTKQQLDYSQENFSLMIVQLKT